MVKVNFCKYIFVLIAFAILTVIDADAQEIKIKSFSLQMEPMTVPMQRKDNNGDICALVKVIIPDSKAVFEGSLVGNCDYKTSEYWCYLTPGSKFLKIKYPNHQPLLIDFKSLIGDGVKGSMIYELVLSIPTSNVKKGQPIKLVVGYEEPSHFPYESYQANRWRYEEDKINELDVYLNKRADGDFDEHLVIENNSKNLENILIGNVEIGDTVTISPRTKSYQEENIIITQEHLDSKVVKSGIFKKRTSFDCKLVDAFTGKPIDGIKLELLNPDSFFRLSSDIDNSDRYKAQKSGITDSEGQVSLSNAIDGFTYSVIVSDKEGYISPCWRVYDIFRYPIDVKCNEGKTAIIEMQPAELRGMISDGKNGVQGAMIEYTSLYGNKCLSGEDGKFSIPGYINNGITIKAEGYKTLVLSFDMIPYTVARREGNEPIPQAVDIKLKKGNSEEFLYGTYDRIKEKVNYMTK